MVNNTSLSPRSFAQLTRLAAKLNRIVGLETVTANRDIRTGTFKAGSSISARSVRAAALLTGVRPGRSVRSPRENFKTQLIAALRSRSIK